MLGEFVSFSESILFNLSKQSWKRGNENFYIEKIPFSFSSGNEYASFCGKLITQFAEFNPHGIKVLECGAGNGIFAKKLIQKLNQNHINYDYTLTEYSQKLIESYSDWIGNYPNANAHFLDIMNPLNVKEFNVAILTYLLDTIPCKCLFFKQSKLYEMKVRVSLKEKAKLVNSFSVPFKDFSYDEVTQFLLGEIPNKYLSLISRFEEIFQIEWKEFPISVSEFENANLLEKWINRQTSSEFYFNFSDSYFKVFENLKNYANSKFMIMCYDFATIPINKITKFESLYGKFGSCYFNNINFSLLKLYCEENNLSFLSSSYKNSENQFCIVSSESDRKLQGLLQKELNKPEPGLDSYSWVKKFDEITDVVSFTQKVIESQKQLSSDAMTDYVYRFSIAKKFYSLLSFENSLKYVNLILDDYGKLALDATVLKSKILRKQYFHKEALNLVLNIMEEHAHYELLYLELIFIYAELNKTNEFQQSLRLYFKHFTKNPQWQLAEMIS